MRGRPLIAVLFVQMLVTGCTPSIDRSGADAAPAGSPARSTASPAPSQTSSPPSGGAAPSGTPTRTPRQSGTTSGAGQPGSEIRRTDWPDVTIGNLRFCGGDATVRFRNGTNGFDIPCTILPYGARPFYADFIAEEPANAPATEDALVLVELGNPGAARRQALVPVQLADGNPPRYAWPVIAGDQPSPSGDRAMTFLSYRVVNGLVEAKVRRLDGGTETRRWRRVDGAGNWERF